VALATSEERRSGVVTLTVPARPEAVRIIRAVTRTWANTVGFVLDEIEELCLAVDEAFAGLIATRPLPNYVVVRIRSDENVVDITAIRDTDAELWPPISAQTALVRRVLSTLIDEVTFERTDEGPAIRMVKKRSDIGNGRPTVEPRGV
jgi:anti-sigma regulatory factor (Ser/Thr protein kinase)